MYWGGRYFSQRTKNVNKVVDIKKHFYAVLVKSTCIIIHFISDARTTLSSKRRPWYNLSEYLCFFIFCMSVSTVFCQSDENVTEKKSTIYIYPKG